MSFIAIIISVGLLFTILKLRHRVEALEKHASSQGFKKEIVSKQEELDENIESTIEEPLTSSDAIRKEFSSDSVDQESDYESKIGWDSKLIEWIKEDWLLKIGAFFLLIGFGWLTTYAFLNNWIGPMGRIALGIIAGAIIIILGWWRIKKYLHQGGIFLVLGSTIVLLTIYAAREIYDFFTPLTALALMFLSCIFVALASVKYKSKSLSLSSLILAGIAPLLTNSPTNDYVALFTYLIVVIIGTVWIVVVTHQRELTLAALIMIAAYSVPHLMGIVSSDRELLLLYIFAISAIFFITNTIGLLKPALESVKADLLTASGNGLLLVVWIMIVMDEWESLMISVWMVVFIVAAFIIYYLTRKVEPFYVYTGVGLGMLAAATASELSGAILTIAYTIETAIVVFLAYVFLKNIQLVRNLSFLFIGPVILSFSSIISRNWNIAVFHKDFFVLFILSLVLFIVGLFVSINEKKTIKNESQEDFFDKGLIVIASIYAYILIWLSFGAAIKNTDTAVMLSLLIYTIIGIIVYFYGKSKSEKYLVVYGGLLLGFVVARLLIIDVWKMELAGRIVTFFIIGALMMGTAFLGRKKERSQHKNEDNNIKKKDYL